MSAPTLPETVKPRGRGKFSRSKDSDLMEQLRQFEVVCRLAMQLQTPGAMSGGNGGAGNLLLPELGRMHFGLDKHHANYCVGRARFDLENLRELERARNRRALGSGPARKQRWQYLDDASPAEIAALVRSVETLKR